MHFSFSFINILHRIGYLNILAASWYALNAADHLIGSFSQDLRVWSR